MRRGTNEFKPLASAKVDYDESKTMLVIGDVAIGVILYVGHGDDIGYAVRKEPCR